MTKNVGTGAALASNTKFYLSINNVWDAFDNVLEPAAGRNVPALNPGASHIASTMLTIPAGTPPGPYYLIARADANGVVAETSEADNTVAKAITIIAAAPDLVVKNVAAPAAADRGASISISELTGNAGGAPTTVNIITRFYLSLNQSVDAADVALGPGRTVGPLAAGAGSTGTTSVVIPAGTAVGNYYLLVRGDDSGQVVESNETNNLGGRLITIR